MTKQEAIDIEVKISCYEVVLEDLQAQRDELMSRTMPMLIKNSVGRELTSTQTYLSFAVRDLYEELSQINEEQS